MRAFYRDGLSDGQPISDEQLRAVGLLALEATSLEESILQTALMPLGLTEEQKSVLVPAHTGFDRKLELLKGLVGPMLKDPNLREKFNQLLVDINDLNQHRNHFIHGSWEIDPEKHDIVVVKRSRRGAQLRLKADELDALSKGYATIHQRLASIRLHLLEMVLQRPSKTVSGTKVVRGV